MKLIQSSSDDVYFNLACEAYLFSEKLDDFLFLYRNKDAVVVGSNQVLCNEIDEVFCSLYDIKIARRISGGGTVFHDMGNINFCFIRTLPVGVNKLNFDFLEPVVNVLSSFEVDTKIGARKDLWLDGCKISGTASHFSRNRAMFHGTLLFDSKLDVLEQVLIVKNKDNSKKGTASVPSKVLNISSWLKNNNKPIMSVEDFFMKLITRFCGLCNAELCDLQHNDIERIEKIIQEKFSLKSWINKK